MTQHKFQAKIKQKQNKNKTQQARGRPRKPIKFSQKFPALALTRFRIVSDPLDLERGQARQARHGTLKNP
jgi:hypothetical protein